MVRSRDTKRGELWSMLRSSSNPKTPLKSPLSSSAGHGLTRSPGARASLYSANGLSSADLLSRQKSPSTRLRSSDARATSSSRKVQTSASRWTFREEEDFETDPSEHSEGGVLEHHSHSVKSHSGVARDGTSLGSGANSFNEDSRLKKLHTISYPKAHGHADLPQVFGIRYCPTRQNRVAVCYADGAMRVWQHNINEGWRKICIHPSDFDTPDPEEDKLVKRGIQVSRPYMSDPRDPITSMAWLEPDRLLFTSGPCVSVCKVSTGLSPGESWGVGLEESLTRCAIHPVSHNHGAMYVCDVAFPGELPPPGTASIHAPASKFCVAGTERKTVIYDARTLQETCCLKKNLYRADSFAHSNRISAVKFFPGTDGQLYLSGSWDNSVSVWDCRAGRRVRFIEEPLSLVGSGPECLDVDRNRIVTACYRTKHAVQIFDFGSCSLIESLPLAENFMPYTCRFVGPEGRKLLVGGKFVNAERQGSFYVVNTPAGGSSSIGFESHTESSAVWTLDHCDGEYIAGHSDGSMGVWR